MPRYPWEEQADKARIEGEMPWEQHRIPTTIYQRLCETVEARGDAPAVSFQITSGPDDPAETVNWPEFHDKVVQAANLFRSLGIGETDTIACVLPNSNETLYALVGGMIAGVVAPINPMLDTEHITSILDEIRAKVVVTLKPFPRTDVAQKVHAAVAAAKTVEHVLEVDLNRYLSFPKSWIVPLIRPRVRPAHGLPVSNFVRAMSAQPRTLTFPDAEGDRVGACFHTGGTTGRPKVVQHLYSGMLYNGWLGAGLLFEPDGVQICALPLFHVFAVQVELMSTLTNGCHLVLPTPAGYRGEGVFDNFWKLVERWKVNFVLTVPTAIAAKMQRPVDADVSSLDIVISGSAPLPLELYNRFRKAVDVILIEGYGLTEATCLVACNPRGEGKAKVGSVGVPLPYTEVRILHCDGDGNVLKHCGTDEVGEICISNPGVYLGHTYTCEERNRGLYAAGKYLRTGDLGRIDADGYLWITGRAKDVIIRGGHNIDPAEIEEALAAHPAVAMAGAIGQPDSFAGELPCAYVELIDGAAVTVEELKAFSREHIHERAAVPKHVAILEELPKTAVGKVFKPDLRKEAIARVFNEALEKAGSDARVVEVADSLKLGLVARIEPGPETDRAAVDTALGEFAIPHEWIG
ncbi:MAG: acyl-CoA synthetase [Rhodobacterales bacterium]|nr:MAG: acyl-CoA synthetase [Rhodobacterales bacterium]